MSSQATGILLFFIVIILSFSSLGLRFVNKKIVGNYFFWSIPAAIFLAYFIDVRFFDDWNDFFKDTSFITGNKLNSYRESITISKALLLDLCPFLGIFLPLSLILDKTRKTSYVMAPFCILGGFTVFASVLAGVSPGGDVEFTYKYLFVGHVGNELYFMLHAYLIIMGFMLVFQSNVNKFKHIWTYYAFILGYYLYIFIIVETTKVEYNTSGVSIRDWLDKEQNSALDNGAYVDGEYAGVSRVFGGIQYPWIMVLAFFLGWLVITIITFIQIFFGSRKAKSFVWKKYSKTKEKIKSNKKAVNNQNINIISNDKNPENETDNSEEESDELIKNDIPSEVIETKDANDLSFMNEIKNPINHADNEYTLKNVLKSSNNGELEYMEEMKQKIYNKKELIHIYPRMFFWKKWKAKKINEQIIMEMEMEFQDNYQNVLAFRNEYKAKMKEYEHKQRIYKESLFK